MGKFLFRIFNAIHSILYRATGGKFIGRIQNMSILLMTTTGRKTGKGRTTPLGYFEHDGGYVVIGSNGGADTHPGWFFNLRSNPHATLQIKDKKFEVSAEIATGEEHDQLWSQLIELAPFYDRYRQQARREIPVVILRPV